MATTFNTTISCCRRLEHLSPIDCRSFLWLARGTTSPEFEVLPDWILRVMLWSGNQLPCIPRPCLAFFRHYREVCYSTLYASWCWRIRNATLRHFVNWSHSLAATALVMITIILFTSVNKRSSSHCFYDVILGLWKFQRQNKNFFLKKNTFKQNHCKRNPNSVLSSQ